MRTFITFLMLIIATSAYSVPARRSVRTVLQPDGTRLTLTLCGDEWLHYMADESGTPMRLDTITGWWRPTVLDSACVARARERHSMARARRAARSKSVTRASAVDGQKHGLVILAEFQDVKFATPNPRESFNAMFNEAGYSYNNSYGSVRDYFFAQSYGRLDIEFDVVGPVTLPHEMSYYGSNNASGDDRRVGTFASDAIKAAAGSVNFSPYDWDGDKEVEQVFIVYAGYGEASNGSDPNTIWPHEWDLTSAGYSESNVRALHYDGVTIDTYACSNELIGIDGAILDGIGTACHEFSHCFGLPDMYDTASNSAFGMDVWSVMDYGCYNCNGYVPASYTAYERYACGWLNPIILNSPRTIEGLSNIDTSGEAYIIYNSARALEYYMIQNLQNTGWNIGAPASGMLIMHIDYSRIAWENNTVNTSKTHQRVSPVCADNKWTRNTLKGDLWPWNDNNALTDTSLPAAELYNANIDGNLFLGHPITDITHEGMKVGFKFDGGADDAINAPMGSGSPSLFYDLSGRRVALPTHPGIYVVEGRKIVVR